MDKTRRTIQGLVYFSIGIISLIYGIYYTVQLGQVDYNSSIFMIYIIPSFILTCITFYFGIKFLEIRLRIINSRK